MNCIKYFFAVTSGVLVFTSLLTTNISAQQSDTLSCSVRTHFVPEGYQLPYRYDTKELSPNSHLDFEDNIVYTFEVKSTTSTRKSITKVTAKHFTLGNEPIDILSVRPLNGSCSIDPNTKGIICDINYSFIESATGPIEYLFNVRSNRTQTATGTSFYIETTEGATSCTGHHFVKEKKTVNPISWGTEFASIKASDFHIEIGDKTFYGNDTMRLVSDPGVDKTTLEATWEEHGVEMRMYMYFQKTSSMDWEMYELRTYNGDQRGEWLYFSDSLGNEVNSSVGQSNYHDERIFVSNSNSAKVYCKNCDINAFMSRHFPVSSHGYSLEPLIGLEPGKIITISNNSDSGYSVNVMLRDSVGNVVADQENVIYDWSVSNPNIANVAAGNIQFIDGNCAYGMFSPCPNINGLIKGLASGQTTITVRAIRNTDNVTLATTSFPVKVTSEPKETSPFSEVDQINMLKEEISQLNQRVDEQQNIISRLNSQIDALRQIIVNFFRNLFRR